MKKLLLLVTILIVTLGFKCNKPDKADSGIFRGRLYTDSQAKTPLGATVFSRTAINPELLSSVDAGINRLNQIASTAPNNYTNLAAPSAYNVYLFPRSPRCENAAFLIDGSSALSYDNGDFDKNPEIGKVALCAAGMVVGSIDYSMLVVDDVATMATIVQYEAEHIALFHADPERYEATKFHTAENYHPILGNGVQSIVKPRSGAKKQTLPIQAITVDLKDKKINSGNPFCVLLTK